jgi:hypothetical protein
LNFLLKDFSERHRLIKRHLKPRFSRLKLGKSQHFCYNSASSRFCREVLYGQVAQSVEQRIENPRVGSSILPLATIQILKSTN